MSTYTPERIAELRKENAEEREDALHDLTNTVQRLPRALTKQTRQFLELTISKCADYSEALTEIERLQSELRKRDKALGEFWTEALEADCHHPNYDGTDECGDIDDCAKHWAMAVITEAFPEGGLPVNSTQVTEEG